MAKAKKKESTLTLEEKLVQALVPESEQPYKVPKNWCWTYIASGFDVTSSKRVHKCDWLTEGIPFYRTRELVKLSESGFVDNELFISEKMFEDLKEAYGVPKIGDILISGVGTIGVPYVVEENKKFYFKDGNVIWFRNKGIFIAKYIFYLYKSLFMINQVYGMSAGTTVDTYTIVNAQSTILPLPPLAEQQRIVDRIENLFAKLDEAKEKLQEVLDSFETRKAAILHKAFTGELTANWREENGISLDSWEYTNLGKYASSQYGFTESATNEIVGPHFLRITDIQNGKVDWKSVPYCNIDREIKNKYKLNVGDIVVARTGATTGKSYLVTDDVDAVFASFLIRVTVEVNKVDYNYVYWFMQSQHYWMQITELSSGIAQPGVNGKKLVGLRIPVPSISEQTVIVGLLDAEWQYEQNAKRMVEDAYNQIDILKKAILARAFRGELGTNDENDECAVELLKRVITEYEPQKDRANNTISKKIAVGKLSSIEKRVFNFIVSKEEQSANVGEIFKLSKDGFKILDALRSLVEKEFLHMVSKDEYVIKE